MPRNPRSYIPPGVGKRVTRAEAAAEAAKPNGEVPVSQQYQPSSSTSTTKVTRTQAVKKQTAKKTSTTEIGSNDGVETSHNPHSPDERSVAETLLALASHQEAGTSAAAETTATSTTSANATNEPLQDGKVLTEDQSSSVVTTTATIISSFRSKKRPEPLNTAALQYGDFDHGEQKPPSTSGSAKSTIYVNPNTPPCQKGTGPCPLDVLVAGIRSGQRDSPQEDTPGVAAIDTNSSKRKGVTRTAQSTNKRAKTTKASKKKI